MTKIRVLAVDDHPMLTMSMPAILAPHGIKVTTLSDGKDVIERFEAEQPDVLVLDLAIGADRGLVIARELLQRHRDARVIVYSQFARDEFIQESYRIGAMAFVAKNAPVDELASAIKDAHAGKTYFPREIAERLALMNVRGDESPAAKLSERELQVFRYMAEGLTNAEIAAEMNLSTKTIGVLTATVRETLGVSKLSEITRLALKYQLIDE